MEHNAETFPDYLNLLDRKLNAEQLAVCCARGNTVVAAGAGSGKTEVLATRFAYLVMSCGVKVDEILTLTFTNKAAAEMYERIYGKLSFFAEKDSLDADFRERAANALKNFSEAHIQTLDSYCSQIVRQVATRYGIRPDFAVGDGSISSFIRQKALDFALRHRADAVLASICNAGKLKEDVADMFAKIVENHTSVICGEHFFSEYLDKQRAEIANAWNEAVAGGKANSVCSLVNEITELYGALAPKNLESAFCKKLFEVVPLYEENRDEVIPEFFKITESQIADGSVFKSVSYFIDWLCKFKDIAAPRGKITDEDFKILKDLVTKFLRTEIVPKVEAIAEYILNYKKIAHILERLDEFLQEVNVEKRQAGLLTFHDVSELALAALKNHDDILQQERGAYKKIMIDEFQDNNGKNRDLLFLLSSTDKENPAASLEADKLFFVGDEKQSIYKFRGADVAVFNQLKNDLGSVKNMSCNYRSTPELLSAFNQIFGGWRAVGGDVAWAKIDGAYDGDGAPLKCVFSESVTAQTAYEATFSKDTIAKKHDGTVAVLTPENVPVHFALFDSGNLGTDKKIETENDAESKIEYLDKDEQYAYFMAQKIRQMVDGEKSSQKDEGKKNKYQYKDFAILCRSTTPYIKIVTALSHFGIPYNADKQKNLFAEALANDIYFLLRLCIYPSDTQAYAVYLRSPFASLSEKSVETLLAINIADKYTNFEVYNEKIAEAVKKELAEKTKEELSYKAKRELSDKIKKEVIEQAKTELREKIKKELGEAECERYVAAEKFYAQIKDFCRSHKITDTLTKLWYESGYRYEYLWNENARLIGGQFDLLFEIARLADAEGKSVAWFVDELGVQKSNYGKSFQNADSEIETEDVPFPTEESNSVKIMTIHKSKGLEFPVVFVVGCFSESGDKPSDNFFFFDEDFGLSFKNARSEGVNYFYTRSKELLDKKAYAEFRRLIYVAVTRAEQEVFVLGNVSKTSSDSDSKAPKILQNIWESYYPRQEYLTAEKLGQTFFAENAPFDLTNILPQKKSVYFETKRNERQSNSLEGKMRAMALAEKFYKNADFVETPKICRQRFTPSKAENVEAGSGVSLAENKMLFPQLETLVGSGDSKIGSDKFGTLAHLYLEAAANGQLASFVPRDFAFADLPAECKQAVQKICLAMAENFLASETGQDFAACQKNWFRTEYAFKNTISDYIVTGSIDLIYKKYDGSVVIVDYKTDLQIVPDRYTPQLFCYRKAAAALFGVAAESVSCILHYLRYGKSFDITSDVASLREEDILQKIKAEAEEKVKDALINS